MTDTSTNGSTAPTVAGDVTGLTADGINLGATSIASNAGSFIGAVDGAYEGATGVLDNTNTITGTSDDGVLAGATNTLISGRGGMITGGTTGVSQAATGKTINAGTITGQNGDGVDIAATGRVVNFVSSTITGAVNGISVAATGTVINAGAVAGGTGDGIALAATGIVNNLGTGTITGSVGIVDATDGVIVNSGIITGTATSGDGDGIDMVGLDGTVANAGTISGGDGVAVDFMGTGTNRLIVDTTGKFIGTVVANMNGTNTLELAAGNGVINLDDFTGFQKIVVDAGADWELDGKTTATIMLVDSTTSSVTYNSANPTIPSGSSGNITVGNYGAYLNTGKISDTTGLNSDTYSAVSNVGSITGTTAQGVVSGAYGSVDNDGSGIIQGATAGVTTGTYATLYNASGAYIDGQGGDGVDTDAYSTVANDGLIQGSNSGVTTGTYSAVTNIGTILGDGGDGITVGATSAVHNDGIVNGADSGIGGPTAAGAATVFVENTSIIVGQTEDGIVVGATGTIINGGTGSITGAVDGISGGAGTRVVNADTITGTNGAGVDLAAGASIVNYATGTITGGAHGISTGATAVVINAGAIVSTAGDGIDFAATGTLTNLASGSVTGFNVGIVDQASGLILNAGTVTGQNGDGIDMVGPGTVSNAGTITGHTSTGAANGGVAVDFVAAGVNVLVVDVGAVFNGAVMANAAGTNTLELGAGTGTLDLSLFSGFTNITVDANGHWTLTNSAPDPGYTFTLTAGSTVTYTGPNGSTASYGTANDTPTGTVTIAAGSEYLNTSTVGAGIGISVGANGATLNEGSATGSATQGVTSGATSSVTNDAGGVISGVTQGVALGAAAVEYNANKITGENADRTTGVGSDIGAASTVANLGTIVGGASGVTGGANSLITSRNNDDINSPHQDTDSTAACFLSGTMLAVPDGEAAVETLQIGDFILTADGRSVPVCWMGINTVSTTVADPWRVLPIRIRAGALADNVPVRDLLVSPDHAMLIDGVLIQAGALVNHVTIIRETDVPATIVYHHVELADHSIILAENARTETFVDNVDRMVFDNWAEHQALYGDNQAIMEMDYPRATSARQIPSAIRLRLAARQFAFT